MIDTLLFWGMVGFGGLLLIAAVSDRLIFNYKKQPGRGYSQVRRWHVPPWAAGLHSSLELVGFLGFAAIAIIMAIRLAD